MLAGTLRCCSTTSRASRLIARHAGDDGHSARLGLEQHEARGFASAALLLRGQSENGGCPQQLSHSSTIQRALSHDVRMLRRGRGRGDSAAERTFASDEIAHALARR